MTSQYAHVLQTVLDGLPPKLSRRDLRARKALRAALDALLDGESEQQALARVDLSLGSAPSTPAAPCDISPRKA